MLQLLLVDERVVDTVDVQIAQLTVIRELRSAIMTKAESLEEVHVDHGRPGRHDDVDHVVAHEINIDLHAAGGAGTAGDRQNDRAAVVLEHAFVDLARATELARAERHLLIRIDQAARVVRLDVDMLDGTLQQLGLFCRLISIGRAPCEIQTAHATFCGAS